MTRNEIINNIKELLEKLQTTELKDETTESLTIDRNAFNEVAETISKILELDDKKGELWLHSIGCFSKGHTAFYSFLKDMQELCKEISSYNFLPLVWYKE